MQQRMKRSASRSFLSAVLSKSSSGLDRKHSTVPLHSYSTVSYFSWWSEVSSLHFVNCSFSFLLKLSMKCWQIPNSSFAILLSLLVWQFLSKKHLEMVFLGSVSSIHILEFNLLFMKQTDKSSFSSYLELFTPLLI